MIAMKAVYLALLIVFAASLAEPVSAYYGASMDVLLEMSQFCPCDIISSDEITMEIRNYGTGTDTYHMSLDLPSDWTGFILPTITLSSGETAKIDPVWITPACGTEPGIYTFSVLARSGKSGKVVKKDLGVEIMACHDVAISTESYLGTCEGRTLTTEIEVVNLGKVYESFSLTAIPNWVTVAPDSVLIDSGETEGVSLIFNPPEGMTGTQNIVITAESSTSYANTQKTIKLAIEECYDFDAALSPPENEVCKGSYASYYLNIDNTGTKADTYRIITPDWIVADENAVRIESMERESVLIAANPQFRGLREVLVTVASTNHPGKTVDATSEVNVVDCRSVAVSMSPAQRNVCKWENTNYIARIENTGTVVTSYELIASRGTLENKKVVLGPGDAQNVVLDIIGTDDPRTYTIDVLAFDGNVSDEDSVTLEVKNCYDAGFVVTPLQSNACKGDEIMYTAQIKNTGEYNDDYTLEYPEGSQFFSLEPGETENLEITLPVDYFWGSSNTVLFKLRSSHGVFEEREVALDIYNKKKCFSVDLNVINGNITKEKRATLQIGMGQPIKLNIINLGIRPGHFTLIVNGPDWAHISKETVFLTPLQEEDIYLYMSPPFETLEKTYTISVIAESDNSVSGVDIDAIVSSLGSVGSGGNETSSNGTLTGPGFTGFATGFGDTASLQLLSAATLGLGAIIVLVLRFAVFK